MKSSVVVGDGRGDAGTSSLLLLSLLPASELGGNVFVVFWAPVCLRLLNTL